MMGHDKYTRIHGYLQIILSSCFFYSLAVVAISTDQQVGSQHYVFFCSEEISFYTHGTHSTVLVQGKRRLPICKRPVRDQIVYFFAG